jgi:hypothetical protein
MPFQDLGAVCLNERYVSDRDRRPAELPVHRRQPFGLGHMLVGGTTTLGVDASNDPESVEVADMVLQAIDADPAILPEEKVLVGLILPGRVAARAQVPKVMMGVDDRHREIDWATNAVEESHFPILHLG